MTSCRFATAVAPISHPRPPKGVQGAAAETGSPAGKSPYLASLYGNATLLRPEEEAYLFRGMNYLKYRASKLREALVPARARASELDEIERLQGEAQAVKNRIIRSWLRLVVSIARRQAGQDRNFFELVNEGNLSLIFAVDKFDVSRGFRFGTYASCAIMRNLARAAVLESSRRHRFVTGHDDLFEAAASRRTDEPGSESVRAVGKPTTGTAGGCSAG